MLFHYPSNRLEYLSELMSALLQAEPSSVFESDLILVENPGMQHWLQIKLAQSTQRISMNMEFPLTSRFVWDVARNVLGQDSIPKQSPYRREVLRFRIAFWLKHDDFTAQACSVPATTYWQSASGESEQSLRRLNLAIALADAFEQYSLFRPDWLSQWEAGVDPVQTETSAWQCAMWQLLTQQQAFHPAGLLSETIQLLHQPNRLDGAKFTLPKRVFLFAVNALAPPVLAFFDALSRHIDVHFLHLNPSEQFWADAQSNKALAYAMRKNQTLSDTSSNVLLANLGTQGKDLVNRLAQLQAYEVGAFESSGDMGNSLLGTIQRDVLNATQPEPWTHKPDNSIEIVSCHTAVREIQVLHDKLLGYINADSSIQSKDIIVLCPAIEDYAPFVYSVFARPGETHVNKLTCTVSDRRLLDSEPLVATFISFLALPDSRFSVSELLGYLQQPFIQEKMGLSPQDIEVITVWVEAATIRWGLNAEQKQRQINSPMQTSQNTWEWGLQRLLTGLAAADSPCVTNDLLTVPHVEGQQGVVLGKLITFLLLLQKQSDWLRNSYKMAVWVDHLRLFAEQMFALTPQYNDSWALLSNSLSDLLKQTIEAGVEAEFTLQEIRELITQKLSSPDATNHFLTGHVTFCSMMPMRSIPFKIVAVLGLNDGAYPRKSVAQSLNLMASTPSRAGDRSRAKEDRYLFLEAILSAREALYLSYQGVSVKDNSERQPSSVLALFLEELETSYKLNMAPTQAPLHSYSPHNYLLPWASFNKHGFRLAKVMHGDETAKPEAFTPSIDDALAFTQDYSVSQIAKCFDDPLAYFAQNVLGVFIEDIAQDYEDDEPFSADALTRYSIIDNALGNDFNDVAKHTELSGLLPDNTLKQVYLEQFQSGYDALQSTINKYADGHDEKRINTEFNHADRVLRGQTSLYGNTALMCHAGAQNNKRRVSQWLQHLLINAEQEGVTSKCFYIKWSSEIEVREVTYSALESEQAKHILKSAIDLVCRCSRCPTLAHATIGLEWVKSQSKGEDYLAEQVFLERFTALLDGLPSGLALSPYFEWFFGRTSPDDIPPPDNATLDSLATFYGLLESMSKNAKVKL